MANFSFFTIFAENCYAMILSSEITYDSIHLVIMAIDRAAQKMNVPKKELYQRLQKQNLIHDRLIGMYDLLHTQSLDYVADDIIETLTNYETEE